jgi:hypothetical protein
MRVALRHVETVAWGQDHGAGSVGPGARRGACGQDCRDGRVETETRGWQRGASCDIQGRDGIIFLPFIVNFLFSSFTGKE